jgi:uncharacterized protein (TIGR02246 family)
MFRALRLACPLVVTLLAPSIASAQAADPAMEKLRTDFEQAWKRGDAKALAALYTEDAVSVNAQGEVQRGRAAIEKVMTPGFAGPFKGSTISITSGASQSLSPDITVAEGRYTITGAMGPDGKPGPVNGHYLNTAVRRGNSWLIAGSAAFIPQPGAPQKPGQ